IQVSDEAKKSLPQQPYQPQFPPRPLKPFLQPQIQTPLPPIIIKENIPQPTKLNLHLNHTQQLTFDLPKPFSEHYIQR
ncbi:hypothetical protein, partial [Staphylococcus hominis]|uniref:hypothetical protein n=1 Tax=Staphylococcus hominis TaxID=1290 RepID=UPI001643CBEA